jgi:hypothetical protein
MARLSDRARPELLAVKRLSYGGPHSATLRGGAGEPLRRDASPHTVQAHLGRVVGRLGVGSRRALAGVLGGADTIGREPTT